jgi:hypothetical protein
MSPAGYDQLAGQYQLLPGAALAIRGGRPVVAPTMLRRLAQGRSAHMLPALLGSVFSLCGHAHRITAAAAVRAAQGDALSPGQELRQRLQAETARDHLQRMALDWPRRLAGPALGAEHGAPPAAWLQACPLITHADLPARALRDLGPWLQERLLLQSPASWLAAFQAEGEAALLRWSADRAAQHPAAAALHQAAPWARTLAPELHAWRPTLAASPQVWQDLAAQLREDAFVLQPTSHQQAAETGPWTRSADAASQAPASAWLRLASRLVDLVQLAMPAGAERLALGSVATGEREGLAWAEMARGLLVHWVRLDEQQRVQDLRVLAPTEWNLHPQGALAQALQALEPADPDTPARARVLATAFDPCVDFNIVSEAHQHA